MEKDPMSQRWEEYNKQNDIGLVTLYHQQNQKQYSNSHTSNILQEKGPYQSTYSSLLDRDFNYRYYSSFRKRKQSMQVSANQNMQQRLAKRRTPQNLLHNIKKRSLKIGYYDVTQMSNLQSYRTNRDLPFLQRHCKNKRNLTLPQKQANQKLYQSKLINKQRLKTNIQPILQLFKKKQASTSKNQRITSVQCQLEANCKKEVSNLNTQRESKPITFIQYRLAKINQMKRQFKNGFRREGKNSLQVIAMQEVISNQIRNRRNSRIRVPSGIGFIHDYKLREAISIYFAPDSQIRAQTRSI